MPTSSTTRSELPVPVLGVCGWSGSGKTTLLERAIPPLTAEGLVVAVVKHDAHGVQVDRPGKDSDRLFQVGANVVLRAPEQSLVRLHPSDSTGLDVVLARLAADHDLVLVEGHRETPLPKVWLASRDDAAVPDRVTDVFEVLPWDGERTAALLRLAHRVVGEHLAARPRLAGVLLGGEGCRMSHPKQLLELDGRTFVERVAAALEPHAAEVVALGAGALPDGCAGLRRLPDPPGLSGPLAGILAALRWAPNATWLITACDLPLLDGAAVGWLVSERRKGVWAVLPSGPDGRPEPLAAAYEPQARGLLESLVAHRQLAPWRLARHPKVASPAIPAALAAAFRNVNTPEDLASLVRATGG